MAKPRHRLRHPQHTVVHGQALTCRAQGDGGSLGIRDILDHAEQPDDRTALPAFDPAAGRDVPRLTVRAQNSAFKRERRAALEGIRDSGRDPPPLVGMIEVDGFV